MSRGLVIAIAVIFVLVLCISDVCCSIMCDKGKPTDIARIRGEIAAGREAEKQQWQEGLEVQIRGLRQQARKLNREGKTVEARQVTAEIIRLNNMLEASRK